MRISRMRFVLSVVVSTLTVCAACVVADSTNTSAAPGSTSWELLLNDSEVREELKLTEEQTKKLQQAFKTVRTDVLGKYRNYRAPDPTIAAAKASEAMETIYAEVDKSLAKVLDADQVKRLKQIDRQQRGLQDENAVKELKLSPEQNQRMQKIRESMEKDARQAAKKFPFDRKARIAAWQEERKKAVASEADLLTAEQSKQWQELTGEPFYLFKFDQSKGVDPKIAVTPPPVTFFRPGFPYGNT